MVVDSIDFSIDEGDFFMFVGLFGCGKMMMFCCIVGFEMLMSGSIWFDGEDMMGKLVYKWNLVMMFQNIVFYLYMKVKENIFYLLKVWNVLK